MSTTDPVRGIEASIRRLAEREQKNAYLVGGTVRDRLLRRRPRDLDVAVEGDAVAFARAWGRSRGAAVQASPAFGTASARVPVGGKPFRVDFSSLRAERYARPGALPDVSPGTLEDDLKRRDFTVNAMAVPLRGRSRRVIDPFGGRKDIRRRAIRMIHPGSPHDDPTRAYRAVRFALRLGFRIAPGTRRWIDAARRAGAFDAVSGDRLRRELRLLFDEQPPARVAAALARERLDRAIDPALAVSAAVRRRLGRLPAGGAAEEETGFRRAMLAWCIDVPGPARRRIADRLGLTAAARTALLRIGEERDAAVALLSSGAPDSEIAFRARSISEEAALAIQSALPPRDAARFRRARRRAAGVRLAIDGEDLKRSGLAAGPAIGRALDRTWRARVDGRIGPREELAFAIREGTR
ncbi:MAG TPA: hypothetical protein VFL12_05390 [Thermoanaerobaculia bacterium]|nr:hypothetical protein [Thermoanaerobaculia bacterium]